jgi:thiol-disulfide isomerase/thioredoxin
VQFYKSDFEKLTLSKKGQEILKAITFDKSYDKTIIATKTAKSFQSDELTELYLCYGLFEVFHSRRVNQNASLNLLGEISKRSKYPQIQILASNIKSKLQLFGKNQNAPDFKLNDLDGNEFQLSDFKGKVVYLSFWAKWSIPSLRELQIIKTLHEKYADKVHFISINVDEGNMALEKIQSQKHYPWTMLHYGDDYKVRERFDVRTVPTYFLIDENGKMLTPFAPGPTDIEKRFYEMK